MKLSETSMVAQKGDGVNHLPLILLRGSYSSLVTPD